MRYLIVLLMLTALLGAARAADQPGKFNLKKKYVLAFYIIFYLNN